MSKEYPITEAVPAEDRHIGFMDMTLTWMGANCQPGTWAIGGTLAAVGFMGAFGITLIANPIAFLVVALLGYVGFKVGTSTMGLTRVVFGVHGTKLPTVANAINILGWTSVSNFFAAITVSYIAAGLFGTPAYGEPGSGIILAIGAALNGLISLAVVRIAGSRSIKVAERVMMVLLIALTTWITVVVFQTTSLAEIMAWRPAPENVLPVGVGVDIMLAFSMTWATVVGEFTRYTKTKISATVAPMLGANLAVYWFALVGTLGVISVAINSGVFDPNNADPSSIAISLGLGWVALLVVIFSTVTTNMVDIYTASYNIMNLFPKMKFNKAVTLVGISCILISWIPIISGSFIDYFFAFVHVIGAIFPPLLAVLVADYYLIRKGRYQVTELDNKNGPYWYKGGFNVYGIGSWLAGVLVYVILNNYGFGLNSIGAIIPGFFITVLIYYVMAKTVMRKSLETEIEEYDNKANKIAN